MMLMATLSIFSCKDDDISESANRDKLFRPAFRTDNNTGKGSTDPYNCTITDLNTAHLYWYTVDDAVAYEIKWAIQNYVAMVNRHGSTPRLVLTARNWQVTW